MKKINWKDEFSVGNEELDSQHKIIVDIVNDLIDQELSQPSCDHTSELICSLLTYSYKHLSYEEDILIDCDYPDFESHLEHHAYYRSYVTGLMDKIVDKHQRDIVMQFLKEWWVDHILHEDMKYKFIFEKEGSNLSKP